MTPSAIIHSIQATDHISFGRKASGLLFLLKHDFNVPPFYLLDNITLEHLRSDTSILSQLIQKWITDQSISVGSTWAVRSSAGVEDGINNSYAGRFKTLINVPLSGIAEAILEVIASYDKIAPGDKCGLIIQQMLKPEYSGVIFSQNPLDPSANSIINIIPGLGESLVSGKHEACIIQFDRNHYVYPVQATRFYGEVFNEQPLTIERSIEDIKNDINPFLNQLIQGCQRIANLRGYPADVEFAIAGNKLYWLQERPISNQQATAPVMIWDNSNIGENYPGITLPLTVSFVQQGYSNAYKGMAAFLGMRKKNIAVNQHLFDTMVGEIYGGLYYNITAWQQLAWQLPFGKWTSNHITKTLEVEDAGFVKPKVKAGIAGHSRLLFNLFFSFLQFNKHKRKFETTYNQSLGEFHTRSLSGMNHEQLAILYHDLQRKLGANWIAPVLNGFFVFLLFSWLKKILTHSRLQHEHPNFINDILYAQGDIISVKIVRNFQKLAAAIREDSHLSSLFRNHSPFIVYEKLGTDHAAFKQEIDRYINLYGERCEKGELKIETINYKEDPLIFISDLQKNLTTAPKIIAQPPVDYQTVIRNAYRRNPLKRIFLTRLIRQTLRRIRDRENLRFYRTRSFEIVRCICRAIDHWLIDHNHIDKHGDSLYLTIDEIMKTGNPGSYRLIIEDRKKKYDNYQSVQRTNRYQQTGDRFVPVEKKRSANVKERIKGSGCCSGRITGKAMIISPGDVPQEFPAGCILVAIYFEPGSIHLFAQAGGIISEKGNLLSHTAILCREMGIPSIIGATGIVSLVKDGDLLQMDGATGEITLLPGES